MSIFTIKDSVQTDPREKLEQFGTAKKLSTEEILHILLKSTTRTNIDSLAQTIKSTLDRLSKRHKIEKGIVDVDKFCIEDFKHIRGISSTRSHIVLAAIELGKRIARQEEERIHKPTPKEVWQSLPELRKADKEHFITILLDSRGKEIGRDVVSIGTVGASLVHPREVYRKAIEDNAVSIIGVHNHPSNEADPSHADIIITERLARAGNVLDIEFEDHVIVTKDGFYSFRENMEDLFE